MHLLFRQKCFGEDMIDHHREELFSRVGNAFYQCFVFFFFPGTWILVNSLVYAELPTSL